MNGREELFREVESGDGGRDLGLRGEEREREGVEQVEGMGQRGRRVEGERKEIEGSERGKTWTGRIRERRECRMEEVEERGRTKRRTREEGGRGGGSSAISLCQQNH